jgi:hypothetical protein
LFVATRFAFISQSPQRSGVEIAEDGDEALWFARAPNFREFVLFFDPKNRTRPLSSRTL